MPPPSQSVTPQVILFVAVRIVINAAYRMIYPFLRAFALGMGVSLQVAALPLTGRSFAGLLGPLLAPVADRYGRKIGMLLGLGMFCLGVGIVALWPSFPAFFIALILANLGNQVFVPAMQAYLGDRVPYQRRGRVLALTELSWSLSFILLIPIVGLLLSRLPWSAPFWLLAGFGLLSFGFIAWQVPADPPHHPGEQGLQASSPVLFNPFWHNLKQVIASPAARIALFFSLAITMANEVVNLVFGVWMNDSFHLQIAELGLAATVIGLAELSGETVTAALVDRIGKKRAVRFGVIFTSLAALALPILGRSLIGGLVGLFMFYLGFEFTLVSYIPLMTEVYPQARATLMAMNLAATSLGRALGALLGPGLYTMGIAANAIVALALNAVALLALNRIKAGE